MKRTFLRLLAGWMTVGPAAAQPPDADLLTHRYVNSREVFLSFQASASPPPEQVEVWITRDEARTWTLAEHAVASAGGLRVLVPEDGRYGVYLVVANAVGRSGPAPAAGTRPQVLVVVDTAPPLLQLHAARVEPAEGGGRRVRFAFSLVEEHLSEGGVRLFYRTNPGDSWRDGGLLCVRSGEAVWPVPAGAGLKIDVCITVTDRAGNRVVEELEGVDFSRGTPPSEVRTEERAPTVEERRYPQEPASRPAPDASAVSRARKLRRLAEEYASQGQLGLAAARLEDALQSLPDDPELLIELGGVLYRAQRYEEATRRFEALLRIQPDHVGAIEGLALVAVTQRRYAEARGYLERLLVLAPQSARHWLRYGDVQYQLGQRSEAARAWRRVGGIDGADDEIRRRAAVRLERLAPESR